jgi:hypothetical protein
MGRVFFIVSQMIIRAQYVVPIALFIKRWCKIRVEFWLGKSVFDSAFSGFYHKEAGV